jgi:hypothetical protein
MPYAIALGLTLLTAAIVLLRWAYPKAPRRVR